MNRPNLIKGNCLIYTLLFKLKNPSAKIIIGWNKKSNIVSFHSLIDGKRVFYKRKYRTQSKYFFNGRIIVTSKINKHENKNLQNHNCL